MTEETPAIETAEEAFAQAKAGFACGEIELFPFGTKRNFAADRMGMVWGTIQKDDPRLPVGKYSGAMRDVAIFLWLGTRPCKSEITAEQRLAGEWTVERAERQPEEAYEAAQEWLAALGIKDADSPGFQPAWEVFRAIKRGEAVSKFRVTTDGASGTPREIESGNSNGQPSEPAS